MAFSYYLLSSVLQFWSEDTSQQSWVTMSLLCHANQLPRSEVRLSSCEILLPALCLSSLTYYTVPLCFDIEPVVAWSSGLDVGCLWETMKKIKLMIQSAYVEFVETPAPCLECVKGSITWKQFGGSFWTNTFGKKKGFGDDDWGRIWHLISSAVGGSHISTVWQLSKYLVEEIKCCLKTGIWFLSHWGESASSPVLLRRIPNAPGKPGAWKTC